MKTKLFRHFLITTVAFIFNLITTFSSNQSTDGSNCRKSWPRLDLIVPLYLRDSNDSMSWRNDEWDFGFYHSFLMFWPQDIKNVQVILVVDEELRNTSMLVKIEERLAYYKRVLKQAIPVRIHFDPYTPAAYDYGYDRQQYIMYTADNYSDADYIGFIDTDAFIHSYVTYDDIFENDKPIVRGYMQVYEDTVLGLFLKNWSYLTFKILQLQQPFMCMTYFPMVIKAKDLQELREYLIRRHHAKNFARASKKFMLHSSQFCIMCTYFFWLHRTHYAWYLHDKNPEWNGITPPPVVGQLEDKQILNRFVGVPKPHIATHQRSRLHSNLSSMMPTLVNTSIQGLCWRNPNAEFMLLPNMSQLSVDILARYQDECSGVNYFDYNTYFHQMHLFERFYNFSLNDSSPMIAVHTIRRKRIENCQQLIIMS